MLWAFPLAGFFFAPFTKASRRKFSCLFVAICFVAAIASCGGGLQGNGSNGGGGSPRTKPGNYTVTLTATCGTVTHSTNIAVTVTP